MSGYYWFPCPSTEKYNLILFEYFGCIFVKANDPTSSVCTKCINMLSCSVGTLAKVLRTFLSQIDWHINCFARGVTRVEVLQGPSRPSVRQPLIALICRARSTKQHASTVAVRTIFARCTKMHQGASSIWPFTSRLSTSPGCEPSGIVMSSSTVCEWDNSWASCSSVLER